VADDSPSADGAVPADASPHVASNGSLPPGVARANPNQLAVVFERQYVLRAADGDQEAVGLLYDAYVGRLYRYCLARVGNETDAEDLAEEIFLKVLGAIDGFEWRDLGGGERSPFAAWLFRIAHNHVVSFHRRATVHRRFVNDAPGEEVPDWIADERRGPQELAETRLTIEEVFALVEMLPEAQREVVRLRFGAGLSVAETAEALGKQQTNVKVLQHKGVQRLKQLLRPTHPDRLHTRVEHGRGEPRA
jgi:RNA polymerase sigma-70 factor (ECF subfamily)